MSQRNTLLGDVTVKGTALHAGAGVTMGLSPAPSGQGVVFRLAGKEIPARYDLVGETRLGTVIEWDGASVGVVEHLMAAIAGAGLDDLTVTLDGPEPPILDGDALSYLLLMEQVGLKGQGEERSTIRLARRVEVREGDAFAALEPSHSTVYDFVLDYPGSVIGRQEFHFAFSPKSFRDEIAPARTFGFMKDLEGLRKRNLALGASLKNTLALSDTGLLNPERQRFADEFVRHKILDAIGDMALAGAPLLARFQGVKSGHSLNNRLLRALFADPVNYEMVTLP